MPTNKEWLYSLDPHALTEWFESEHFECPTDGGEASMMCVDAFIAEHVSQNETAHQSNVSEDSSGAFTDTREKLEADAMKLLNSESVEQEMPQTAENATSKNEIRDSDVWSVAYEIYCAGGYVDDGSEPNPPTEGIRKLLDRQANLTARTWSGSLNDACAQIDKLQAQVNSLVGENGDLEWRELHFERKADELQAQVDEASRERELYRARLSDLLDAVQEAWRVGQSGLSLVDMDGEVVS